MKKNIILLLLFVLALGGGLLAKENLILKVKVQTANVRSGPDAAATVIARVSAGTLLEVSDKEGAWYEVTVNDESGKAVTGYIHNSVVEVIGEDEASEETEEPEEMPRADVPRKAPRARVPKAYAGGGVKLMGGLAMGNFNLSAEIPATVKKTAKMGLMGGLGFESGGQIAFELDLFYSPGGMVIKSVDPANKAKMEIIGTAITMPILLKVRLLRGTTPYILAGGEVGYTLNQKIKLYGTDGTLTGEEDIPNEEINRFLYAAVFGGGLEMQAGGMSLLFEARYRLGLSNMIKDADPGEYVKPTALTFLFGVKF
jgi:hypothetical protein